MEKDVVVIDNRSSFAKQLSSKRLGKKRPKSLVKCLYTLISLDFFSAPFVITLNINIL